eukprot:607180-Amphidinium_carterae.1
MKKREECSLDSRRLRPAATWVHVFPLWHSCQIRCLHSDYVEDYPILRISYCPSHDDDDDDDDDDGDDDDELHAGA